MTGNWLAYPSKVAVTSLLQPELIPIRRSLFLNFHAISSILLSTYGERQPREVH